MRRLRLTTVGVVLGCLGAAPLFAHAQSLVDVAQQEKTRRAGIAEKSKVYTNDDLRGGRRLTTGRSAAPEPDSAVPASDVATGSADPVDPDTDSDGPLRDEAYWRDRITSARDEKRRTELIAAALQNRVDGLWADFTARDDPLQRSQIERDRTNALQELDQTRADIARLDQEIRDTQEEARRAGVPPGWLR